MPPDLQEPAYQHVLINHVPIIGLGFAILALAVALVIRSRAAQILALGLVAFASASLWVVNETGHGAFEQLRTLVDDTGAEWMDVHYDRAESAQWAFYSLAVLAAVAALLPRRWPRAALTLTATSLVLGLVCLGLSGWIAKAGGQIRHSEFRHGPPPQR